MPDRYPLPFEFHDLSIELKGKNIFSKIDLIRAYHHIPMTPDDIQKTAITIPFGMYEFVRMLFVLWNSAQTFQRFINEVFFGLDFVLRRLYLNCEFQRKRTFVSFGYRF